MAATAGRVQSEMIDEERRKRTPETKSSMEMMITMELKKDGFQSPGLKKNHQQRRKGTQCDYFPFSLYSLGARFTVKQGDKNQKH